MDKEYTQEQLWELYEKLPQETRETIFSEKTAENIFNICVKNGIQDNKISDVARYTGRVLMQILTLDEFLKTLEKEVKLNKDVAQKVAQEINRLIFAPVKNSLTKSTEITTPSKEEPKKPPRKDIYHEPIE